MSTPQLDKRRKHGTIWPPYHGAMYSQDGMYFSGSGEFLFREGHTPGQSGAQASAEPSGAPASPEAPETRSTGAEEPKIGPRTLTLQERDGKTLAIDLASWARGEVKAPFFSVKKAVAEAYPDIDTKNANAIKAGLKAKGVI